MIYRVIKIILTRVLCFVIQHLNYQETINVTTVNFEKQEFMCLADADFLKN